MKAGRMSMPSFALAAVGVAWPVVVAGDGNMGSKEVVEPLEEPKSRSICEWIEDSPGLLYESDDNPYIQSWEIGGRFQYQAAYLAGKDVNGRHFHDTYDEFRRVRLDTELQFLRFLKAELSVNLVDDRRFRDSYPFDLSWGYDTIDQLTMEIDFDEAFDLKFLDKLEFTYGKMKVAVGEEAHQSSREIITIERSAIIDRIGGEEGRPTGGMLSLGRGDWELSLGVFSGDANTEYLGSWNDGQFYYASLEWEPTKRWRFVFDQIMNDPDGIDLALGYAWASSLAGVYTGDRWGILVNGVYGDNGGVQEGHVRQRRQGDFWGCVVMQWYWLLEDKLQFVVSYEYQASEELEGIRLDSRYVRARHQDVLVDVGRGRGDLSHKIYAGLNYYICGHRSKIMGGVSHTELRARRGDVSAMSYLIAYRGYF